MNFRLSGAKNKNPALARTFAGLRVTDFQKKTSSWGKLQRRNYIPLGSEIISELEAVKRRSPCFKRVHSVGPLSLRNCVPQSPFCPNLQSMYEEKNCYPLTSCPLQCSCQPLQFMPQVCKSSRY